MVDSLGDVTIDYPVHGNIVLQPQAAGAIIDWLVGVRIHLLIGLMIHLLIAGMIDLRVDMLVGMLVNESVSKAVLMVDEAALGSLFLVGEVHKGVVESVFLVD